MHRPPSHSRWLLALAMPQLGESLPGLLIALGPEIFCALEAFDPAIAARRRAPQVQRRAVGRLRADALTPASRAPFLQAHLCRTAAAR